MVLDPSPPPLTSTYVQYISFYVVYVYSTYMCTCTRMCIYISTQHLSTLTDIYIHICIPVHMCTIHICAYVHIYVSIYRLNICQHRQTCILMSSTYVDIYSQHRQTFILMSVKYMHASTYVESIFFYVVYVYTTNMHICTHIYIYI